MSISAGGLSPLPNFQKRGGGLTGPPFLERGYFFRGMGGLPKKGGLGQFADLRRGGGFSKKEEGSVFEGVVIPNAHYVHKSNGGQIAATKNCLLQLGLRTKT